MTTVDRFGLLCDLQGILSQAANELDFPDFVVRLGGALQKIYPQFADSKTIFCSLIFQQLYQNLENTSEEALKEAIEYMKPRPQRNRNTNSSNSLCMLALNTDVMVYVFQYLEAEDLLNMQKACRRFMQISRMALRTLFKNNERVKMMRLDLATLPTMTCIKLWPYYFAKTLYVENCGAIMSVKDCAAMLQMVITRNLPYIEELCYEDGNIDFYDVLMSCFFHKLKILELQPCDKHEFRARGIDKFLEHHSETLTTIRVIDTCIPLSELFQYQNIKRYEFIGRMERISVPSFPFHHVKEIVLEDCSNVPLPGLLHAKLEVLHIIQRKPVPYFPVPVFFTDVKLTKLREFELFDPYHVFQSFFVKVILPMITNYSLLGQSPIRHFACLERVLLTLNNTYFFVDKLNTNNNNSNSNDDGDNGNDDGDNGNNGGGDDDDDDDDYRDLRKHMRDFVKKIMTVFANVKYLALKFEGNSGPLIDEFQNWLYTNPYLMPLLLELHPHFDTVADSVLFQSDVRGLCVKHGFLFDDYSLNCGVRVICPKLEK
ncbi:hypothetical protein RFI_32853 [Reticulomyxa filosa]|uniref:F-box domain-containing protein n=1 Tax=Reticulomyxa filosa TaxID=46433 RepID=X6LRN2_RETFI|nr:hypothetical protein RFI_32853 [Reticulomyxa filosa]|eukprot:ETO04543.1 hypothetical protein RFI_32853 [Reticulomyxa filosa]